MSGRRSKKLERGDGLVCAGPPPLPPPQEGGWVLLKPTLEDRVQAVARMDAARSNGRTQEKPQRVADRLAGVGWSPRTHGESLRVPGKLALEASMGLQRQGKWRSSGNRAWQAPFRLH